MYLWSTQGLLVVNWFIFICAQCVSVQSRCVSIGVCGAQTHTCVVVLHYLTNQTVAGLDTHTHTP